MMKFEGEAACFCYPRRKAQQENYRGVFVLCDGSLENSVMKYINSGKTCKAHNYLCSSMTKKCYRVQLHTKAGKPQRESVSIETREAMFIKLIV